MSDRRSVLISEVTANIACPFRYLSVVYTVRGAISGCRPASHLDNILEGRFMVGLCVYARVCVLFVLALSSFMLVNLY